MILALGRCHVLLAFRPVSGHTIADKKFSQWQGSQNVGSENDNSKSRSPLSGEATKACVGRPEAAQIDVGIVVPPVDRAGHCALAQSRLLVSRFRGCRDRSGGKFARSSGYARSTSLSGPENSDSRKAKASACIGPQGSGRASSSASGGIGYNRPHGFASFGSRGRRRGFAPHSSPW